MGWISTRRGASYITGWINLCAWVCITSSVLLLTSEFGTSYIYFLHPNYNPKPWHQFLLYFCAGAIAFTFNLFANRFLPYINKYNIFFTLTGFIATTVTVLLVACASPDFQRGAFVFGGFWNEAGWPDGWAWQLGLLQGAFSVTTYDATAHMIEEIREPAKQGPKLMLSAIAIVTINGFCFVATILAVTKKPHEAADSTQPLLTIYYQATGSKAGSICLTMLQPVSFVLGSIDTTATSARMAYALARDGGMPWSQLFAKVPSHFRVPVIGHVWCFCWDIVLALIFLASGNAFNTIISAAVVSFTISHAMPTGISVLRRRRLLPENRAFKPPGLFGYICNIVAVAWAILTTFLFVWPTNSPTNAENMNYCIAAFGVFILVSGSNWIFSARKHYTPPALAIITPDEPQCAGRVAESDFTDKTEGVMTEKAEDITIANSDREME